TILLMTCCVIAVVFCRAAAGQSLQSAVENKIRTADLGNKARYGVAIYDLSRNEVLAEVNPTPPITPGSNMKLVETGASLLGMPKDFTFQTRLLRLGDDLVIRGDGDPAFGDPALLEKNTKLSVDGLIDWLAQQVKKAGITSVRSIIVDDRVFDDQMVNP